MAPSSVPARSVRRPAPLLAAFAAVLLVAAGLSLAATAPGPAAAQARLVTAFVRTFPARPQPGTDVVTVVGVQGCPAGPVTVELYLIVSDGTGESAALVARAAATTNLLRRTRAVVELPDAIEGWYGARVLCGAFRPPKTAMANTLFAVGTKPGKEARLETGPVTLGEQLTYSGDGCPGDVVEYDIRQGDGVSAAFQVDGSIPVGDDGTWSAAITFPTELGPGPATVRARCIRTTPEGGRQEIYYGGAARTELEPAPVTPG